MKLLSGNAEKNAHFWTTRSLVFSKVQHHTLPLKFHEERGIKKILVRWRIIFFTERAAQLKTHRHVANAALISFDNGIHADRAENAAEKFEHSKNRKSSHSTNNHTANEHFSFSAWSSRKCYLCICYVGQRNLLILMLRLKQSWNPGAMQ